MDKFSINETMGTTNLEHCGTAILHGGDPEHAGIVRYGQQHAAWNTGKEIRRQGIFCRWASKEIPLAATRKTDMEQREEELFLRVYFERLRDELSYADFLIAEDLVEPRKAILDYFPAQKTETAVRRFWQSSKETIAEIRKVMQAVYEEMSATAI